jgi:hypothetical protein
LRTGEGVGFGVGTTAIDGLGLGTGELVTGGGEGVGFGVGTTAIDGLGLGTGELVTIGEVVSVF